ncbi:aminoglycoside phosphotransferase family protein [Actinopolymorpha sp. NPDC004070]|uniref:phosphotransferase family protein n=1 Tax=Actinopolymorpha sp. NPDC004070 TaxID=3154548 RepID=UPI0033B61CCE
MSRAAWGTHAVELAGDQATKRFPEADGGCGEREWRALTLLHEHAPGLAPEPVRATRDVDGSTVVMSRLPGTPLRGLLLSSEQLAALATAMHTVHTAVPVDVLRGQVPIRPNQQAGLVTHIRRWAATLQVPLGGPLQAAMSAGLAWLDRSRLVADGAPEVPPVFGPGDGNLANYLWDGSRVRIVDFEDSGRSDRAFELAEVTEHVGSWVEQPLDVAGLLGQFELTPDESARLRECRRLLALVWLFLLSFDVDNLRNPPGTVERQAERLMALLD